MDSRMQLISFKNLCKGSEVLFELIRCLEIVIGNHMTLGNDPDSL